MEALEDKKADLEPHPTANVKPVQLSVHEVGDGRPSELFLLRYSKFVHYIASYLETFISTLSSL